MIMKQTFKKENIIMNNPIKNHFQKVYAETNVKPFTFLNCFLCIFLPVIGLILGAILMNNNEKLGVSVMILAVLGGWAGNFALLYKNFKAKGISLFFLNLLASIAFFFKLIIMPLFKALVKIGAASTRANLGNTTARVNSSNQAGAALASTKTSAFNWFEYDGYKWKDNEEKSKFHMNSGLDEGFYTDAQNQAARDIGYANGKEAEMAGRQWDGKKYM